MAMIKRQNLRTVMMNVQRLTTMSVCKYLRATLIYQKYLRATMIRHKNSRAVIALILLTIITSSTKASAQNDPFPLGRFMMSQGAIVDTEGASGREPWASAALYRDTLSYGAAVAMVSYHGWNSAARYAVGGFYDTDFVTFKASLAQLDVMRVYYEQDATLSAAATLRQLSFVTFGADAAFRRIGLYDGAISGADNYAITTFGASLLLRAKRLTADVSAKNIIALADDIAGIAPPVVITARVTTIRGRYGSQGALLEITPDHDAPIRVVIAQEYAINDAFSFAASISSNPTMIGFGINFAIDRQGAGRGSSITSSASFVNHPFLGWSQGISADYAR